MDFNTNNGTNKPSLPKSGSKANFSHAAVNKTDVGDFKAGYFVMADMPQQQQRPHKTHKTPERNQRKNEHYRTHQSRERSTKDIEQLIRESDPQVSHGRVPTSPTRSPPRHPKRNFHSPPQQALQAEQSLSPHKPRKAQYHHEKHVVRAESNFSLDNFSGSPPKDKGPSPPSSNRWAGPAFSNAPPPSSLPMPEFPPFQPSATSPVLSPSSPIISSSPPSGHTTTMFAPQQLYLPPTYAPISAYAHQPAYSIQFSYGDAPVYPPQNLAQLSTDLRRMLNISQPIPA